MKRFPKGTRKIVVEDQTWHWLDNGGYNTVVWDPLGNKRVVSKSAFAVGGCDWSSQWSKDPTMPADVRRFIEVNVLKKDIPLVLDPKAIPGRLYAHREKHIGSAPYASIWSTTGGQSIQPNNSFYVQSPGHSRWEVVRKHFEEQKPFVYLRGHIDLKEKNAYYEILVGDIITTILIPYPRTWSGSFIETTAEWQRENNA